MIVTWKFSAFDSYFFRESRPHGLLGDTQLSCVFPPPARTIVGAVRTLIGENLNIDWGDFSKPTSEFALSNEVKSIIGTGDDNGQLSFSGPWITKNTHRLYPAPLYLFKKPESQSGDCLRLQIGRAVHCDLGQLDESRQFPVRLPELPGEIKGAKPAENIWLRKHDLELLLKGDVCDASAFIGPEKLYGEESRLGIGINQSTGIVKEGLLYQTTHVRPYLDMAIEIDINGGDKHTQLNQESIIRLGGEGRLSAVSVVEQAQELPAHPESDENTIGLILQLLSHANLGDNWLPAGFTQEVLNGIVCWKGEIEGVPLRIHASVIGRAHREGGWDMVNQKPRSVCSLIPAGSAWYCTVENQHTLKDAIKILHGCQIGNDQSLGRGLLAVGLWQNNELIDQEKLL